MKFKYNGNEKNVVKGIIFIILLIEFFKIIASHLVPSSYPELKKYVEAITVIVALILIYFGKEAFFSFIFSYIPSVKNKIITGRKWNITISFTENNENKTRTGMVEIKNTISGVRLIGGQLIDNSNKRKTMNNWFSESAEIIKFDNHAVLFYVYKIPGDSEKHKKIGFVYAIKKADADCFEGFFYDMRTNETGAEAQRNGEVAIYLDETN